MNKEFKLHPHFESVVYSEQEVQAKVKELAAWVDKTYAGSTDLVIVGILKGCLPFMADLTKEIKTDHVVDYMIASSYGGGSASSGSVKIVLDLATDITDKEVLVVEDIIESGITINKVKHILEDRNPRSLKFLTLVDKPFRKQEFEADKVGFLLNDHAFLVVYGLDYQEKLRQVPYIGIFNKSYLDDPYYTGKKK